MDQIYSPKVKIAIASSFEGVVNNGATECALTSFNAYKNMPEGQGKFFKDIIEPERFPEIRNSEYVQAFLALRPLVRDAEDYLTVLQVMESCPEEVRYMLNHPKEEAAYKPLEDRFEQFKAEYKMLRDVFGGPEKKDGTKSKFYQERARMVKTKLREWRLTQEPYKDSIEEFRKLIRTQEKVDTENVYDAVKSGFVPWFATSKDEYTTKLLCEIYAETNRAPEDFASPDPTAACVITSDRLVGKNKFPEKEGRKVNQLKYIAETEGLHKPDVWRLDDRYGRKDDILELRDAGFIVQFIVPGYMFPHEIQKAKNDKSVMVIDRNNIALQLAERAKEWGY